MSCFCQDLSLDQVSLLLINRVLMRNFIKKVCKELKQYLTLPVEKQETYLENRKSSLLLFAFLGLVLFFIVYFIMKFLFSNNVNELSTLQTYFLILILGLPTFFMLWLFRTHDALESINNSSLFFALQHLSEEKNVARKTAGLVQLMYLKNVKKVYKDQIKFATPGIHLPGARLRGINLSGADLEEVNLSEARLQTANLSKTYLQKANLSEARLQTANLSEAWLWEADLTGADLTETDLTETDLTKADLRGTKLRESKNLEKAILENAVYRKNDIKNGGFPDLLKTEFPDGFNPDQHGMIEEEDED